MSHKVKTMSILRNRFMEMYICGISGLLGLTNETEKQILAIIWRSCVDNDRFEVKTLKEVKGTWAKECGCSMGTVNNTITKLVKKGIIVCTSRSVYTLDSDYFSDTKDLNQYHITVNYIINDL